MRGKDCLYLARVLHNTDRYPRVKPTHCHEFFFP